MSFPFVCCRYGAHGLTLSKIVPHICHLLGDPTSQVRVFFCTSRLLFCFRFHEMAGIVVSWSMAPPAGDHRDCNWHWDDYERVNPCSFDYITCYWWMITIFTCYFRKDIYGKTTMQCCALNFSLFIWALYVYFMYVSSVTNAAAIILNKLFFNYFN